MHRLAIVILLFCGTLGFAQKWTREKNAPPQPATEAYFSLVSTTILKSLAPEFAKHYDRLNGELRVALLIDRQGHIQVEKVVSTTSNRWVQDTALRVVRSVKLPPLPKQVIVEQGREPVRFEVQWTIERHD